MNNEPVAWMEAYNQGYNDCLAKFVDTHPAKTQYKFGVDWSKDGNAVTVLKIHENGVAEVVFMDYQEVTHPAKTLTDEEILCLWDYWSGEILAIDILDFADKYRRAILNEEAIIEWHQEYCKKMNEEDAKKVDTYKSQNNNQIDTYRYKNLTDEEIRHLQAQCHLKNVGYDTFIMRFARAILKKASEK
jgi:hypothetical protein